MARTPANETDRHVLAPLAQHGVVKPERRHRQDCVSAPCRGDHLGAALGGVVAGNFGLAAPFTLVGIGHLAVLVLGWRLLARAGRTTTEVGA